MTLSRHSPEGRASALDRGEADTPRRSILRPFAEQFIDPLLEAMRVLSRYCAWAGGVIFFAAALLITFEVLIRKLLSMSLGGADELSGYGFAVATTFAFCYAALQRAHIRVDTLRAYSPPRIQALLDVVAAVLLLVYFTLLMKYGWRAVADTMEMDAHSNTSLRIPLIVPQLAWWLGLFLTFITASLLLLRALVHISFGEFAGSNALIGTRDLEEEVSDELRSLEGRSQS
jgi:TRAP-type C4-dicarboxylate transport system permease small subunit